MTKITTFLPQNRPQTPNIAFLTPKIDSKPLKNARLPSPPFRAAARTAPGVARQKKKKLKFFFFFFPTDLQKTQLFNPKTPLFPSKSPLFRLKIAPRPQKSHF
jgi:hypothetical protein